MIRRFLFIAFGSLLLLGFVLGADETKIQLFTPDPEVNREIANKSIYEIDFLVYDEGPEGLTIDPVLPSHWKWLGGRGYTSKGERVEFIFRNGHVYASSVKVCAFRNRTYPDIITGKITSNAYTIGFRKYDETMIFVATNEPKDVHLAIDKSVFGEEKVLDFHLGKNESKLIRIFPKEPPYRP